MALFNKLFPGLRTTPQNSHEDNNVSHKASSFSTEQVRLVLFRECDFRGRKLLFDSDATQKVLVEKAEPDKKFVEVCNEYGYLVISKQNSDYQQLSEMAFGSVAMSFRGTYLKIHSLSSPARLIFTQVFPSPHNRRRPKSSSTSSNQSHLSTQSSFEHSIKLDDSGANSSFSTSDRLSDRSTASDTVLVCRRLQSSPLDVPRVVSSFSKNSLVVDSGCVDPSSFSSVSTGPLNFPTWESVFSNKDLSTISFSSSGIFRRLLRSSTRSLHGSSISLPNSNEVLHKGHHKGSKLGLTIIVEIPLEKEKFLTQFFMEHVALLEALIWRTHRAVEIAYHRPSAFISLMMDIAQNTAAWLVNLVNAPRIVTNLWHCLSFSCDNSYSNINAFISDLDDKSMNLSRTLRNKSLTGSNSDSKLSFSSSFGGLSSRSRTDLLNFNFSRFLKPDWDTCNRKKIGDGDFVSDKFLKEFCELLEKFDVKDTNFFVSTLLTSVLTHHLGWVATVFPSSTAESEAIFNLKHPYNALWSQLTDLYGAIGHPVKTAQTVITGSNKNNVISKILNSLTYFIRFGNIERRDVHRSSIEGENKTANVICVKNNCIPKESYKKYEDHLKELMIPESPKPSCSNDSYGEGQKCFTFLNDLKVEVSVAPSIVNMEEFKRLNKEREEQTLLVKPFNGLTKIKSYTGLTGLVSENPTNTMYQPPQQTSSLVRVSSSLGNVLKTNLVKKLSTRDLKSLVQEKSFAKLPEGCDENQNNFTETISEGNIRALAKSLNYIDLEKLEKKTELEKQGSSENGENQNGVIFVLGENEKLVGLKKDEGSPLGSFNEDKTEALVGSGAKRKMSLPKRPSSLSLSKTVYDFAKSQSEIKATEPQKDPNCKSCLIYSSSSYESLCLEKTDANVVHTEIVQNLRAQSEPPELRKSTSPKNQYSRVKFNIQQYPQVVKNYMKSKNIELEGLSLGEKVFDKFATVQHNIKLDLSGYESDSEEVEALHTPSNASELEFSPDMGTDASRDVLNECSKLVVMPGVKGDLKFMKLVNIPMPKSLISDSPEYSVPYTSTVFKGLVDTYIPDMVLQGTTNPKQQWDAKLKSNLAMNTQHSLLDQTVDEALAIVANTDTWEVQVMSSHTYVIDKGTNGVTAGMSQLVASMLESLLQMWKLHIPPQYCIMHIEQRLQELCLRSKALAQMLLASEFCSIELLTSTLRIEVNDVPLLMAVASTHTPEVTRKYGLSFH